MAQQILTTNTFTTAKWIVSATASDGTHTTIASALTSASSGDTIFIRPGTYTESLTLKAGVNLSAFPSDCSLNGTGNVIINGNCTFSLAGTVTISGIQLQTNSAALLTMAGSAATIVNLINCYINCSNTTGIAYSTANISSQLNIYNCQGNLGTTGIALFSDSSTGNTTLQGDYFTNTGNSVTANTKSNGSLQLNSTLLKNPITYSSSSSSSGIFNSILDNSGNNTTMLTSSGTGSITISQSYIASGTSSAISVGTGTTLTIASSTINSSNTNALTGAGTLNSYSLVYSGSSHFSNVTTQAGGAASGITQGTAPAAGFIGEQISSVGTSVGLTNNTPKTLTTITLTAGIWDISCVANIMNTGSFITTAAAGISTTDNTFTGTLGDDYLSLSSSAILATQFPISVANKRKTISASTTYYLVAQENAASGTLSATGRITATRVG